MQDASGQSILEIIIAIGFAAIIVLALSRLLAGNFNVWQAANNLTQAKQIAQEQIEAVYALRLADWHNLFQYATSTAHLTNGSWQLSGEGQIGHKDKFSWWLEFGPVYRLADGSLALSDQTQARIDPLSRQVVAKVSWQDIYQKQQMIQNFIYLTAWQAEEWEQTNWSGGDGQLVWQADDKYWQAEGLIDVGTVGQIKLNLASSTSLATGTLFSSAFDTSAAHKFLSLGWSQVIPTNCIQCNVQVQIKTAADNNGQPGEWTSTWCGPDGDDADEDDWFEQAGGELISADHNNQQWIKYRIKLTGNQSQTPIVEEIRVYYE